MNETEKRRRKLLYETRERYRDTQKIPAVHPRYKASYAQLYPEDAVMPKGTFGLRCMIAVICFSGYILMEVNHITIAGMDFLQVSNMIMQNYMDRLF